MLPARLAGSWDSDIRAWDVRSGACLHTCRSHHSDVYGLASHPARPLRLASASRDTSIRLWGVAALAPELLLQVGWLERLERLGPWAVESCCCGAEAEAFMRMPQAMCGHLQVGEALSLGMLAPAPAQDSSSDDTASAGGSAGSLCGPAAAELRAKLAALQGSSPEVLLQRSRLLGEFFCCPSGELMAAVAYRPGCNAVTLASCD